MNNLNGERCKEQHREQYTHPIPILVVQSVNSPHKYAHCVLLEKEHDLSRRKAEANVK